MEEKLVVQIKTRDYQQTRRVVQKIRQLHITHLVAEKDHEVHFVTNPSAEEQIVNTLSDEEGIDVSVKFQGSR